MKAFFSRRTLMLIPFACGAIYGCIHTEEAELPAGLADVLFEGTATDEAMVALGSALDQASAAENPARAPVLDMPTASMLPKGAIPTFTWHAGGGVYFMPQEGVTPEVAPTLWRLPESTSAFHSGLAEFLGPVKSARAHGDPLVGPATFLTFSTATNAKVVRVFTTLTSYTPGQTEWDKLVAANAEITLSLIGADFDNNRIADSGGPFQGTKFLFTITP
jgi:hypothetical protein